MKSFSLYVHIPFCHHKCPYCDFNTYAVRQVPAKEYTTALMAELDFRLAQEAWAGRPVQSIFFGGGTPSLMEPRYIQLLVDALKSRASLSPNLEFSIEANPSALSLEFLSGYLDSGINRLSIGAQSFDLRTLKALGRTHSPEEIEQCFATARQAGFKNINLDLIYGAPQQSVQDSATDIAKALALKPNHLSFYGLTVEQGTPLHAAVHRKDVVIPNDDLVVQMMLDGKRLIESAGLKHYEISNFAIPGFEARHNLAYWNGDDYLGLGAGAHSFIRQADGSGLRWSSYAQPATYMEHARTHGTAESWHDTVSRSGMMFEFFFLGLRKRAGVSINEFQERFCCSFDKTYPDLTEVLCGEGLLERKDDILRITDKGLPLADGIIENFAQPEC